MLTQGFKSIFCDFQEFTKSDSPNLLDSWCHRGRFCLIFVWNPGSKLHQQSFHPGGLGEAEEGGQKVKHFASG